MGLLGVGLFIGWASLGWVCLSDGPPWGPCLSDAPPPTAACRLLRRASSPRPGGSTLTTLESRISAMRSRILQNLLLIAKFSSPMRTGMTDGFRGRPAGGACEAMLMPGRSKFDPPPAPFPRRKVRRPPSRDATEFSFLSFPVHKKRATLTP